MVGLSDRADAHGQFLSSPALPPGFLFSFFFPPWVHCIEDITMGQQLPPLLFLGFFGFIALKIWTNLIGANTFILGSVSCVCVCV